jgi:tetratricopeptide (TPR) repeat protein
MDYYGPMLPIQRFAALLLATSIGAHAQAPDTPSSAPTPSALDGELFYQLLLGELSAQGGDPGTGFSLILDAARKTGDARLFQRAVEIALQARSGDSALQAARAWKQAQPNSRDANRYVLQILIGLNRLNETIDPLKREIALVEPRDRASAIAMLPRFFARSSDKKLAVSVLEQALAEHLSNPATGPAAWTALGRMRLETGDAAAALDAARQGQALDARADGPALLALALMGPAQPQAEALVRKYLEGKPQPEVRMAYARALLDAQRYAEATEQIRIITLEKPDYEEAWLIQGTLELQDNKPDAAEKSIQRYVELAQSQKNASTGDQGRGLAQAYLSLAQIAEQRKDFVQAEKWLTKITSAEDLIRAQSRRAGILARQGKVDEARKLIRNLPERSPEDVRLKLSAEVQLLRDNKLYQSAYDLLAEYNRLNPGDYDLVYDQATLAEKLGNTTEMERLLRRIMADKPDYHHAYNALGYSFAERNIRLSEARQLILKALEYAPGDPFITDSLGWVEFRSGNKPEALRILQAAYKLRPDAEIAAHLGEVLWSMGQREQAMSIWREGVQLNADNETLTATFKRLRVKP